MRTVALLLVLVACGAAGDDDRPMTRIADVELSPPPRWQVTELGAAGRVWSPIENPRKQTITVLVGPPTVGAPERALAATESAFGLLRDARILSEEAITTSSGLVGRRFKLAFRPDVAIDRVYTRTHVVLLVGDHSVHVIETSARPDPEHAALGGVLATIRKAV